MHRNDRLAEKNGVTDTATVDALQLIREAAIAAQSATAGVDLDLETKGLRLTVRLTPTTRRGCRNG